jgi:nucleolar complex protein 3
VIKSARTDESLAPLSLVAITCATNLLVAVPHFNFRTDLLKIIVAQLSRRSADEAFTKCREAVISLFIDDEEGRASLEAVTMISKMVKTRHYKVNPLVHPPQPQQINW